MARNTSVRRQWISQYDDYHNKDLDVKKADSNNTDTLESRRSIRKKLKHGLLCGSLLFLIALHLKESTNNINVMDNVLQRSLRQRNLLACPKKIHIAPEEAKNMPYAGQVSKVYTPPSHVKLCQELLSRNAIASEAKKSDGEKEAQDAGAYSPFFVEEADHVCEDWSRPHAGLMEIIASSVVAYVGERFNIQYNHNCHKSKNHAVSRELKDIDMTTIQQIFPQLNLPINENTMGKGDIVHELCKSCIEESGTHSTLSAEESTHHCLLFPEIQGVHTEVVREQRMKAGKYETVEEEEALDAEGHIVHTALEAVLPLVKNRLYHAALDWSSKAQIPGHDPTSGTVIYIDAGSSLAIPFHLYQDYISLKSTHVSILTGPKCADGTLSYSSFQEATEHTPHEISCAKYGSELREYLQNHYTVPVTFDIISSTAAAFSRMIMAKTLVCAPGTTTCLLPALSKERTKMAIVLESPEKTNTYHWFTSLGSKAEHVKVIPLVESQLLMDPEQMQVDLHFHNFHPEDMAKGSVEGEPLNPPTVKESTADKVGNVQEGFKPVEIPLTGVNDAPNKDISSNTIELDSSDEVKIGVQREGGTNEKVEIPLPMIKTVSEAPQEIALEGESPIKVGKSGLEEKYEPKETVMFPSKDDYLEKFEPSHVRETSPGQGLPDVGVEARNFVSAKEGEETSFRFNSGGDASAVKEPEEVSIFADSATGTESDADADIGDSAPPNLEELVLPEPTPKAPPPAESEEKQEARMKSEEAGFL